MRSLTQISPAPSDAAPVDAPMRTAPAAETASPPRGSRVLFGATLLSLAWGAAAAATIALLAQHRAEPLELTELAALSAGIAAPLAAIWLAALTIARVAPGQARASMAEIERAEARMAAASLHTRDELASIDQALVGVATRVDTVRASVAVRAEELMGVVGQLEARTASVSAALSQDRDAVDRLMARVAERGAETQSAFAKLIEALPAAEARAGAIGSALASGGGDARAQVEETETLLSALWSRNEAARHMAASEAAKLHEVIGGLDAAGERIAANLDGRAAALEGSVERALSRTESALDASRAGVEAQAAALAAGIEQARVTLGRLGAETDQSLTARLAMLSVEAERLAAALADQEARSNGLLDIAERGFGVLDARLAHAAQTTGATLDRIGARIGAARERADELIAPLAEAKAVAAQAEAATVALGVAVGRIGEEANSKLPEVAARAEEASQAVQRFDFAPVEAARLALADTVETVAARLTEARTIAEEVEASANTAAATAATRLVEALNRVHDVSAQAEGAMRRALDGVVADARAALEDAGETALRGSFADPIRAQLGTLEASAQASADAARTASERLSRQLMGLVDLAATVEGRIAEADAKLDAASQGDIAHRASLLVESLNSHAIDIAKALSNEVPDTAWAAYLRGDRGIFTRRAVRLLDRGAAKAVAKRFEEDGEFRDEVRGYIHDFETLLRRVGSERSGSQLSVALVSSEVGRLYVALAQAIERLRG